MTTEKIIEIFKEWVKRDSEIHNLNLADRDENIEIYKFVINALSHSCEGCKYNDGGSEFKCVCYSCSRTHIDNYTI